MIELLSWNVAARKGRLGDQVTAIRDRGPDILALQEVTPELAGSWETELANLTDLRCAEKTLTGVEEKGARGVLLASRWPLERLAVSTDGLPFPEKMLGVVVHEAPGGPLEVYTTHVPRGVSNGWDKIRHLEALHRCLSGSEGNRRVLCGDFNAPRDEWSDGTVITWAQDPATGELNRRPGWRLRRRDGDPSWDPGRWDAGERNVLEGLAQCDLTDVFRILGRFPPADKSWYWRGFGRAVGRPFDHVFASKDLLPRDAGYLHGWRDRKLSDHSAVLARFQPRGSVDL
jgi:endonuclease/exonuclease/phosphatase family metal-dependent hydrolase